MVVENNNPSSQSRSKDVSNRSCVEVGDLVSVIIPTYKMADFLPQALQSVEAQTYDHWEVIVVNDGGPEDGTADIVARFAARNADHRIEFIRHEINRGVSAARNTAIRHAQAPLLAFLDPDDFWEPDHLDVLVKALVAEGCTVVCSQAHVIRDDDPARGRSVREATKRELRQFPASLAYRNFITGCATLIMRDAVGAVGGFDESPEIQHAEDYDLWIRLVKAGARFHFVPDITYNYRKHAAAATNNLEQVRQRREVVCRKHVLFFVNSLRQLLEVERDENERMRTGFLSRWVPAPMRSVVPRCLKRFLRRLLAPRTVRRPIEERVR